MRNFSPFTLLVYLLFHSPCLGTEDKSELPNIILVMADDQGYGDAGFTGHPFVKTPNLDAMADRGIVFNRFYASAPVCSPTRASVLTGRHPFRTNVPNHGHYLRPQETTLAEALKSVGYVTGHFGKWHIGSVQAESPTCPGGAGFDEWLSGLNFFDKNPYLSRNGRFEQIHGLGSVITMDAAIDFVNSHANKNRPFFSVIWFPSPHDPHEEHPQQQNDSQELYANQNTRMPGYYREITLLDEQLGRLRTTLSKLKIANHTLLFYCSDNGGLDAASSGGRKKKGSIYEGGLRVPAILEWPAQYKKRAIDSPATTSDLYPTLIAITGAKVKDQPRLDGIDLTPILLGKQNRRPGIGFWHGHTNGQATWSDRIIKKLKSAQDVGAPSPFPGRLLKNVEEYPEFGNDAMRGHAAWNAWPWKLHRIQNKQGDIRFELYHLIDDPMESNDLSTTATDRRMAMTRELESWQQSVLGSWAGQDY